MLSNATVYVCVRIRRLPLVHEDCIIVRGDGPAVVACAGCKVFTPTPTGPTQRLYAWKQFRNLWFSCNTAKNVLSVSTHATWGPWSLRSLNNSLDILWTMTFSNNSIKVFSARIFRRSKKSPSCGVERFRQSRISINQVGLHHGTLRLATLSVRSYSLVLTSNFTSAFSIHCDRS